MRRDRTSARGSGSLNITRSEQFALLVTVAVILAGLVWQGFRSRPDDGLWVDSDPRWHSIPLRSDLLTGAAPPDAATAGLPSAPDGAGRSPAVVASVPDFRPPVADGFRAEDETGRIDLNLAGETELMRLPGIGPSRAAGIIQDRQRNGPFGTVDELDRVSGIGPKTLEKLRPYIMVSGTAGAAGVPKANPATRANPPAPVPRSFAAVPDRAAHPVPAPAPASGSAPARPPASSPASAAEALTLLSAPAAAPPADPAQPAHAPRPAEPDYVIVNINTASTEELERIPGVGPVLAGRIADYRRLHPFKRPEDLIWVKGVGEITFRKMRPYIRVD